jgi:hypothetical protein
MHILVIPVSYEGQVLVVPPGENVARMQTEHLHLQTFLNI